MRRSHATVPSVDQRPRRFSTVAWRSRSTSSRRATSPSPVLLVSVFRNTLIWASSTIHPLVSWHNAPLALCTLGSVYYVKLRGVTKNAIFIHSSSPLRYLRYGLLRCHEAPRLLHYQAPTTHRQDRSPTQTHRDWLDEMVPGQVRRYHPPWQIDYSANIHRIRTDLTKYTTSD